MIPRFTRSDIYSSVEFNEPLQSNSVGEFIKAADHEASLRELQDDLADEQDALKRLANENKALRVEFVTVATKRTMLEDSLREMREALEGLRESPESCFTSECWDAHNPKPLGSRFEHIGACAKARAVLDVTK